MEVEKVLCQTPNDEGKKDWEKYYTPKNIQNLTYEEILAYNRERNKGTFMDRSWRDKAVDEELVEKMSRKEKFLNGHYSLSYMSTQFALRIALQSRKTEFLQKLILE